MMLWNIAKSARPGSFVAVDDNHNLMCICVPWSGAGGIRKTMLNSLYWGHRPKSYAFKVMSFTDFVHSLTFLKLTKEVKNKGYINNMFLGQDWSLSPKHRVFFTIYVSLLLALSKHQTKGRSLKLLILNVTYHHQNPTQKSYGWWRGWWCSRFHLFFLSTFVFPTGLCELDQSLCH